MGFPISIVASLLLSTQQSSLELAKSLIGAKMLLWKKKPEITRPDGWLKVGYQDTDIAVRLFGRLDHTLRGTIRGTLQSLLKHRGEGAICFQMMDVFLLDPSTAAGLIAFLRDAERSNRCVEVRGASPVVKQVFKELGASELLNP